MKNKIPRSVLERKAERYKELINLISKEGYVVTTDPEGNLILEDINIFYSEVKA